MQSANDIKELMKECRITCEYLLSCIGLCLFHLGDLFVSKIIDSIGFIFWIMKKILNLDKKE